MIKYKWGKFSNLLAPTIAHIWAERVIEEVWRPSFWSISDKGMNAADRKAKKWIHKFMMRIAKKAKRRLK